MKITSMQKMIAIVVVFVVAAVAAVFLLVVPMFGDLDSLTAQKAGAQQQLDQANAQLSRLEEAKSRSAATEAQLLKIGTQMPDSPQLPTLIIELQNIANDSGVSVTSFSPAQPTPAGQFTEISMTTQLTTKWADLLDYLKRLSSSTRLLRVTNVTVNPAAASTASTATVDPDDFELNVSLTTKAYVIGTNGVVASSAPATSSVAPTTTTP
jgi:Tfp pilus assembly protein PilO